MALGNVGKDMFFMYFLPRLPNVFMSHSGRTPFQRMPSCKTPFIIVLPANPGGGRAQSLYATPPSAPPPPRSSER